MGAEYTDAQHNATNKYRQSKAQISLVVDRDIANRWRMQAEAEGKSLSKWITEKCKKES